MKSYEPTKAAVRIGDILQDCGMVTAADLERALDLSKKRSVRLGEALVELGVLSEDQLTWALGVQFDLSFVDLNREMIDWDWLMNLPLEELVKARLLPLTLAEGAVLAVIADPTTPGLRETLHALFPDFRVVVQVAAEEAILEMLEEARVRRNESTAGAHRSSLRRGILPTPDRPFERWVRRLTEEDADAVAALHLGPAQTDPCVAGVFRNGRANFHTVPAPELDRLREDLERRLSRQKTLDTGPKMASGLLSLGTGEVVRAGYLEGLGRRMLIIEAIKDQIPPAKRLPVTLLCGRDPVRLKALALRKTNPSSPDGFPRGISLEVRLDFRSPNAFQVEIPDEAARLRALRWVLAAIRPRVAFLEIERPEEIGRVSVEPAWPGTGALLVVPRIPLSGADFAALPPGVESLAVAEGEEERVLEEMKRRIEGENT